MYLHIGNDVVVRKQDIIGIFDIENTTTGKNTSHLLERATKEGRVVNVTNERPKSFVVCDTQKGERVYICQVSVATLKRRQGELG